MVDITKKSNSLRIAVASAVLQVSSIDTMVAIKNRTVPKGDVFEFARAAGLLAIKKTSDVIPDCHPLPIEFAKIIYEIDELDIHIQVEVHTIYKTGVEVEAMHGASIVALTMYDMLKPLDKNILIKHIKLNNKKGGKSDIKIENFHVKAAVLVCSDTVYNKMGVDTAGKIAIKKLREFQLAVDEYEVIPDEIATIQQKIISLNKQGFGLILITGGTGLSNRDLTPEAVIPLIDTVIPGIMETARFYGQQRNANAMLSRGIAGFMNDSLIITVPGSETGVSETIDAIFPSVLHVFKVRSGQRHA